MRELILITALIGAAALSGCGTSEAKSSAGSLQPAVTAAVLTVAPEPFEAALPVTGTLVSNAAVEVKAEVAGRVTRFEKEEGAHVAAGEPVAWVNDENYRLSLRQAETAVKVAEAGVERVELLASHSRSELDRAENLLKSGGITDNDLKSAELADRDARAQVALAMAQLDQARAVLEVASKHIRDTIVRSPISGEMQKKLANKGAYVEAPTPMFVIVDNSRLELHSPVPSVDIGQVQRGQRVTFTVNSYPGVEFEGRVIELAPAVDEATRSAKLRVQVANTDGKLKAGMFAQGEIHTGVNQSAVVIPAGAVYRDDRSVKSSHVFVVVNGKAAKRNVRIGNERDSKLEILDGLKPGDLLITEQKIEVAEGVAVEPGR